MAHLQYFSYKGVGEENRKNFSYSQVVKVGNRLELSGQGGWDPATGVVHSDLNAEIDQAFANIELALKDAGGKGFSQVFRVRSYHVNLDDDTLHAMVKNMKKHMPDHQPIWTCLGIAKLALEGMRVEIEVEAIDE